MLEILYLHRPGIRFQDSMKNPAPLKIEAGNINLPFSLKYNILKYNCGSRSC